MMLIIFTDLDGTLLNQDDYRYEPAIPILKKLKEKEIPVVPVTSKTRSEVEVLRQQINLTDPFIVENGSGVFVPLEDRRFVVSTRKQQGNYHLELLGCTYDRARSRLQAIAQTLGEDLRGFGDLTETEIAQLTGLKQDEAKRAKTREFTEPFVTPHHLRTEQIEEAVEAQGLKVVIGDRFSHLIGGQAGKGKAVRWLMQHCQPALPEEKIVTVGLGNSPNDLEMLETVDFPIIIPGHNGPHPGLAGRGWKVAPHRGSQGWAEAVAEICDRRASICHEPMKSSTTFAIY